MAGRFIEGHIRCSFCGRTENQVDKMISGPTGIYICDECVDTCVDIIEEEYEKVIQEARTMSNIANLASIRNSRDVAKIKEDIAAAKDPALDLYNKAYKFANGEKKRAEYAAASANIQSLMRVYVKG